MAPSRSDDVDPPQQAAEGFVTRSGGADGGAAASPRDGADSSQSAARDATSSGHPGTDAEASSEAGAVPAAEARRGDGDDSAERGAFRVSLANFDGPFDLLLQLITQHEMDITEIALSKVTDEFIAYLRDLETGEELERASEFLVVAATLLDMKVAGLLPQGELVDAESVALLEARDLLFARLLQYRAFKEAAAWFSQRFGAEEGRHARSVPLDPKHRSRTPELVWTLSLDEFAALALLAFTPKDAPSVGLDHLHAPLVSIREQAAIVVSTLRSRSSLTFRELVAGIAEPGVVVARFISVLELYRHAAITFEQLEPLGELTLRWATDTWSDETLASLGADYDR